MRIHSQLFVDVVNMCSVQEDDLPLRKDAAEKSKGRLCMKCKEQQAILITRVNDAFCRACFQVYVTHKFRATIGKTKLVRDGELILVGFSGGPSSAALLHLIQEGLSQRAHKKLRFKPGVVFIDEGACLGLTAEERLSNCERVKKLVEKTGFPCYIRALEEALDVEGLTGALKNSNSTSANHMTDHVTSPVDCDTDSVYSSGTASVSLPNMSVCTSPAFRKDDGPVAVSARLDGSLSQYHLAEKAEQQLRETLAGIKSTSSKQDFIRTLRLQIFHEVAKHRGYSKVMLGNCGTQLAVRLLTDISTGRGAHAAIEASFADRRFEEIMFLRPLRDFSSKEVAMYNNLHKVDTVFIPTLTTKGEPGASLEHLTETFVTGLQADYPSTVSNIMRTGEKLDTGKEQKIDKHCAMCQGPLDTSVGAASALSAVEFSQSISRCKVDKGDNSTSKAECCGEGDGSCQTLNTKGPSLEEVICNLCYGCRLVVREMDDMYRLPDYVLKDVAWRGRRLKMQDDIKDFLLDNS